MPLIPISIAVYSIVDSDKAETYFEFAPKPRHIITERRLDEMFPGLNTFSTPDDLRNFFENGLTFLRLISGKRISSTKFFIQGHRSSGVGELGIELLDFDPDQVEAFGQGFEELFRQIRTERNPVGPPTMEIDILEKGNIEAHRTEEFVSRKNRNTNIREAISFLYNYFPSDTTIIRRNQEDPTVIQNVGESAARIYFHNFTPDVLDVFQEAIEFFNEQSAKQRENREKRKKKNPDIKLENGKVLADGQPILDIKPDVLHENIVLYKAEKGNFFAPEGWFFLNLVDTNEHAHEVANAAQKVNRPIVFFPGTLARAPNFPVIWKKKMYHSGIIGAVQGQFRDGVLHIEYMSVRPKFRRNKVNTAMIDFLKHEFKTEKVTYHELTKEGEAFHKSRVGEKAKKNPTVSAFTRDKAAEIIKHNINKIKIIHRDAQKSGDKASEETLEKLCSSNVMFIAAEELLKTTDKGVGKSKYEKEFSEDYYKYVSLPYPSLSIYFTEHVSFKGDLDGKGKVENYEMTGFFLHSVKGYRVQYGILIDIVDGDNRYPGLLSGYIDPPTEYIPEFDEKTFDFEELIRSFLYFYHSSTGVSYGVGTIPRQDLALRSSSGYFSRKFDKFIYLKSGVYKKDEPKTYDENGITYINAIMIPSHPRHFYLKDEKGRLIFPLVINKKINGHDQEGNPVQGWTYVQSYRKPKDPGVPLLERYFLTEKAFKKNPLQPEELKAYVQLIKRPDGTDALDQKYYIYNSKLMGDLSFLTKWQFEMSLRSVAFELGLVNGVEDDDRALGKPIKDDTGKVTRFMVDGSGLHPEKLIIFKKVLGMLQEIEDKHAKNPVEEATIVLKWADNYDESRFPYYGLMDQHGKPLPMEAGTIYHIIRKQLDLADGFVMKKKSSTEYMVSGRHRYDTKGHLAYITLHGCDPEQIILFEKAWDRLIHDLKNAGQWVEPIVSKNPRTIPGGLSEGMSPSDFKKKSLKRGTKVEMEHTTDPKIAQEIAMDHLVEDPKYYSKLARMEKNPTSDWGLIESEFQPNPVQEPEVKMYFRKRREFGSPSLGDWALDNHFHVDAKDPEEFRNKLIDFLNGYWPPSYTTRRLHPESGVLIIEDFEMRDFVNDFKMVAEGLDPEYLKIFDRVARSQVSLTPTSLQDQNWVDSKIWYAKKKNPKYGGSGAKGKERYKHYLKNFPGANDAQLACFDRIYDVLKKITMFGEVEIVVSPSPGTTGNVYISLEAAADASVGLGREDLLGIALLPDGTGRVDKLQDYPNYLDFLSTAAEDPKEYYDFVHLVDIELPKLLTLPKKKTILRKSRARR